MIPKKILFIATALLLIGVGGCRKQLDINQNPNVAQEVTPALLLPTAQLEIGSALGVDMNNNGSIWVQYWTQSPSASQYRTLERYQPTASTYDRVWGLFYTSALPDLKQMNKLATTANLKQYQAISMLLMAYSFQLITDAWGDVPFKDALKGLPEEGSVLNPRFDRQDVIYDSLIQMTMTGMAMIDPGDVNLPSTDDIIYHGDMEKWARFGNTLLLKMYIRLSERNPARAQAGITALFASPIGFIGEGDDAQINYSTSSGSANPLAVEDRFLGQNQVASATSADSLNSNNDPRRLGFYTTSGTVVGLRQGASVGQTGVTYTIPNPQTGANAGLVSGAVGQAASSAPVKFLTSYESLLLQAEAVARGWDGGGSPDDDSTLFAQAVIANFRIYAADISPDILRDSFPGVTNSPVFTQTAEYAAIQYLGGDTLTGLVGGDPVVRDPGSYWGRYPVNGTIQQKIRHIITQKWFCMNGNQGFEAWTEWRRTGYPEFLIPAANNLTNDQFPNRFFYPDVEFSRNANFPGQPRITDRVWWDVN